MDERQAQIRERLETVRLAQEESLERREALIRDAEIANQMTRRELEQDEEAKKERRKDIDSQVKICQNFTICQSSFTASWRFSQSNDIPFFALQVAARRKAREEEFKLELQIFDEDKKAEDDYEKMLRKEAEKLSARGFQPKVSAFFIWCVKKKAFFMSFIPN